MSGECHFHMNIYMALIKINNWNYYSDKDCYWKKKKESVMHCFGYSIYSTLKKKIT